MGRICITLGVFLGLAAASGAQTPSKPAARTGATWTAPRAADGHADLSGVWANNAVTPVERPQQWAAKDHLTDAELQQLKRDISRVYSLPGILAGARMKETAAGRKSNQDQK
jgi:hypothetical protein